MPANAGPERRQVSCEQPALIIRVDVLISVVLRHGPLNSSGSKFEDRKRRSKKGASRGRSHRANAARLVATRAGHYERKLHTKAGEVTLKVPKLRVQTFETAIIERYRRRESSVEEALIEMYLAGVSVRRVEDITEALWGTQVSPGTAANLNKKS